MRGSEPEPPPTNRIAKDRFAEIAGSPAGGAPAAGPAATEGGKPRQIRKEAAVAAQSVCRRLPWPPAGARRCTSRPGTTGDAGGSTKRPVKRMGGDTLSSILEM